MNLEEARKTKWFKNYPKTMGELLDEGYLHQARLEWAAEKAYVPQIKEAAKAILESKKHISPSTKTEEKHTIAQVSMPNKSFSIKIPLEKARATFWPFKNLRGQPMGLLVDSQQLSLQDLAYAIENAWDNKVRQAAITLSLVRLEQALNEPDPEAGFIHVVSSGRSFATRKQSWLTLLEGIILGSSFTFLLVLSIALTISSLNKSASNGRTLSDVTSTPEGIIGLVVVFILMLLLAWLAIYIPEQLTNRLEKQIEEYRLGQEGEDQIVQSIVQALDGNWYLFRNVNIPGPNKGDLDVILVGPSGVWVLEVKNFRGIYRNIGEIWEYRQGKKWKRVTKSPSHQAINNAARLGNFLKADKVNIFVTPVVVWVNQESPLTIENPSVAVWQYSHLPDELGNIWQGEKLSESERKKIADKLTKLCELQKKTI